MKAALRSASWLDTQSSSKEISRSVLIGAVTARACQSSAVGVKLYSPTTTCARIRVQLWTVCKVTPLSSPCVHSSAAESVDAIRERSSTRVRFGRIDRHCCRYYSWLNNECPSTQGATDSLMECPPQHGKPPVKTLPPNVYKSTQIIWPLIYGYLQPPA